MHCVRILGGCFTFTGLDHTRQIIEDWRVDYNAERSPSSLDDLTPEEFIQRLKEKTPTVIAVENTSPNVLFTTS